MANTLIVFVTICLISGFCTASNYVPLVFWTNMQLEGCKSDILLLPGEYGSKFTESKYFQCLQKYNPTSIKIFILPEFDVSDLSVTKISDGNLNSFEYIQSAVERFPSVVMPATRASHVSHTLETMKKQFVDSQFSISELTEIQRGGMEELDQSIGNIDHIIQKEVEGLDGDYFAILTAEQSPEQRVRRTVGRHLLATADTVSNGTTLINGTCAYIHYNYVTLTDTTSGKTKTSNLTFTDVQSKCTDTTANMTITFTSADDTFGTIKLALDFTKKLFTTTMYTWWYIDSAKLIYSGNNATEYKFNSNTYRDIYTAPQNWSWVCQKPSPMKWAAKGKKYTMHLQFNKLQIQAFNISNEKFSRSFDCSGILTGPIWVGVVVTLLLVIIFTFGMKMFLGLSTMDRFDDPHGKSIIIASRDGNN